jgi:hypothetical protein
MEAPVDMPVDLWMFVKIVVLLTKWFVLFMLNSYALGYFVSRPRPVRVRQRRAPTEQEEALNSGPATDGHTDRLESGLRLQLGWLTYPFQKAYSLYNTQPLARKAVKIWLVLVLVTLLANGYTTTQLKKMTTEEHQKNPWLTRLDKASRFGAVLTIGAPAILIDHVAFVFSHPDIIKAFLVAQAQRDHEVNVRIFNVFWNGAVSMYEAARDFADEAWNTVFGPVYAIMAQLLSLLLEQVTRFVAQVLEVFSRVWAEVLSGAKWLHSWTTAYLVKGVQSGVQATYCVLKSWLSNTQWMDAYFKLEC